MNDLCLLNLNTRAPQASLSVEQGFGLSGILAGAITHSGQAVSQTTAIRAGAVLTCLRILMEDVGQLPLRLHRQTPRGATLATDHSLYRILDSSPNPWQTSTELREGIVLDCLLNGTAFCEKIIGPDGVTALYPLAANRMLFKDVTPDGVARWYYTPPPYNTPMLPIPGPFDPNAAGMSSALRILLADDLWRVSLMSETGFLTGRSLVLLAREAIGLALAAEEQGARLFSNGVQTGMVLKTAESLDHDAREQLQKSWAEKYSGSGNSWKTLLLENGIDVAKIGLTAQESQYIEARQFQLQDIARIFRIPSVLLGISDKQSTHSSAQQFFDSYTKFTIQPWARRIEQSISRDLLAASESDLFAKHDLDVLLRANLTDRYAAHQIGIQAGFLTRNEARQIENLPQLDGLDEPVLLLNIGTQTTPTQPAKPAPPDEPSETEAKLASALATNCVGHEMKLLADGKARSAVYATLLPGYLASKTGLPAALCAEYCKQRAAQPASDEREGVAMLRALLLTGQI